MNRFFNFLSIAKKSKNLLEGYSKCDDYRKVFLLKIWLEGGKVMSYALKNLMEKYVEEIRKIYANEDIGE